MILLVPIIASIVFLTRAVLVTTGIYKDPILQSFENYGPDEPFYFPIPQLMYGAGALLASLGLWIGRIVEVRTPVTLLGILLLVAAYFIDHNPNIAKEYPQIFLIFPRWYHELRARTDRYERRQIAYRWHWLPRRLRLTYNSNSRAFFTWVDLVLMANIREEGDDGLAPRRFYR